MKRLLVATLALTSILTACSDDKETVTLPNGEVAEVSDADAYLEVWEKKRAEEAEEFNVDVEEYSRKFNTEETPADIAERIENETEEVAETEVDNSERHQFEVGESLAEKRKTNEEINAVFENYLDESAEKKSELDMAIESASKKHNAASKKADEYAAAYEGRETFVNYHTRMDTVNIDVLNAELYRSGGQSRMSVEFNVENTANEQKKVPLIRSVIVTDGGFQAEGDRQLSVEPEWDLMGATKTSGEIIFDLELEDIDAIESVTLVIPGVDFRSDFEERIEINFNE